MSRQKNLTGLTGALDGWYF